MRPKYRVFICTKQRDLKEQEGCCYNCGAIAVYEALQAEIKQLQLEDQVEIRKSGCLDHCEAGVVALVYQPPRGELSWLPQKIQRRLISNKHLYGHLQSGDIPELVESHFVNGQVLKRLQIAE